MKKVYFLFILCLSSLCSYSQNVSISFLTPGYGINDPRYKFMEFGHNSVGIGGFMWNQTSPKYGNGNDFTMFSYGNRDIVLQPESGNVILFPDLSTGGLGVGTTAPASKAHFVFNHNSTTFGTTAQYLVLSNNNTTPKNHSGITFSNNAGGLGTSLITARHNRDLANSGRLTFYTRNLDGHIAEGLVIDEKSNIGLGIAEPADKLHLYRTSGVIRHIIETNSHSMAGIHIKHSNHASTIGFPDNSNVLKINNTNSFGDNHLVITETGKIGINTQTPGEDHLAVNGTIKAKEVKVTLSDWPDYVFEESYSLPTLEEVEHHIKENGHLKDIPSATDVEENGVNLGEMDMKLLQKIEELTLYMIEQGKQIEDLRKENKEMKNEMKTLLKK